MLHNVSFDFCRRITNSVILLFSRNNPGPALVKKLFSRGILPVYKNAGTSKHDLAQWIKLSLCFESSAIKRNNLFLDFVPRYPELYMTGVCAVGFGFYADQIAKYRKYMKHEFLVKAILGIHTFDSYSGSPVLAQYPYKHISTNIIKSAMGKFVGNIEQSYPTTLLEDRKFRLLNGHPEQQVDSFQETVSDDVQVSRLIDDTDNDSSGDEDEMNNSNLPCGDLPVGRHPTLRIKKCYSIELLQVDDAVVQMRIICDGFFSCRAFVRDLGLELGCHASIDQLHLKSLGPFVDEQALHKHELHLEQIVQSITENAEQSQKYFANMKVQYPEAITNYRFI